MGINGTNVSRTRQSNPLMDSRVVGFVLHEKTKDLFLLIIYCIIQFRSCRFFSNFFLVVQLARITCRDKLLSGQMSNFEIYNVSGWTLFLYGHSINFCGSWLPMVAQQDIR
jgi:hypothetical protein